uniref:NACHT domain-containing protein n=1 Tax=Otolemur garnettii TaxID=30611 RepID=H0Y0K8_OTOGA
PRLEVEEANGKELADVLIDRSPQILDRGVVNSSEKMNLTDLSKMAKGQIPGSAQGQGKMAELEDTDTEDDLDVEMSGKKEECRNITEILPLLRKNKFQLVGSDNFLASVIQRSQKFIPFLQPRIAPQPIAHTVVLYGPAGVGKSTLAKQVFLDWAENNLNQMFNYVFYLRCKELNHVGACSFAELIFKDWPEWLGCAAEVFGQAQKILFIIDGFEELRVPAGALIHDICGNWEREMPVPVLLGSLLKRKMLPKASLLVTTRPEALRELRLLVEQPLFIEMEGLLEPDRRAYFLRQFADQDQALRALDLMKGNVVQKLFSKEERVRNPSLTQVGYFLFGLSNEKRVQELESTFGCRMSLQIREELLKYRANLDENKPFSRTDMKELLYCLYESQDEGLMRDAMVPFTEVSLHWMNTFEVMYSSFCLKHCQNLQKLSLQIARGIFLENDPVSREDAQLESWSRCDHRSLCVWMDFCSVVSSNKNLRVLDMTQSFLSDSSVRILCDHITRFSCHLQKVVIRNVTPDSAYRDFCLAFVGKKTLTHLTLEGHVQWDDMLLLLLGEVLKHVKCSLQYLRLGFHSVTTERWTNLTLALKVNQSLMCLDLSDNELLDESAKLLYTSLKGPKCLLQRL